MGRNCASARMATLRSVQPAQRLGPRSAPSATLSTLSARTRVPATSPRTKITPSPTLAAARRTMCSWKTALRSASTRRPKFARRIPRPTGRALPASRVAAHGNKCPKNRAQSCTSCNMLYKLSKDKKTCVKIVTWKYMLSNNGKCPKTQGKKKFINLKTGKAACNAAAKALGLPDLTSRTYTNNYQPTGCYMYKSGSYHDLRYNTKGKTTSTSRYYLSICLNTVKEPKKCPGDTDGNKKVNVEDLLELLGTYGKTGSGLKADFKADKKIDVEDLLIILSNYGKKC